MLSADTALEVRPLGTSGLDAEVNKPSDTLGVDRLERIGVEDLVAEILTHEGSDIVTGEAECHLCQVIGAE